MRIDGLDLPGGLTRPVLDLVSVVAILVLTAVVISIAKGVEKL